MSPSVFHQTPSVLSEERQFQEWQRIIFTHRHPAIHTGQHSPSSSVCVCVCVCVCVRERQTVPVDDDGVRRCLVTVPAALLVTAPTTRRRQQKSQRTDGVSSDLQNNPVCAFVCTDDLTPVSVSHKLIRSVWNRPKGRDCGVHTDSTGIKIGECDMNSEREAGSDRDKTSFQGRSRLVRFATKQIHHQVITSVICDTGSVQASVNSSCTL